MKRLLSILIFSILIPGISSACECADKPSIQSNWEHARQVFLGEVIGFDTSEIFDANGRPVTIFTIRILETFKEDIYKNYDRRTLVCLGGGTCDSYFEPGKKYLIYANWGCRGVFLKSSICSRTNLLDKVDESEIAELRKLNKEFQNKKFKDEHPGPADSSPDNKYELDLAISSNAKLHCEKKNLIIISSIAITILSLALIYVVRKNKRQ